MNSVINSARNLMERAQQESAKRSDGRVDLVISELNSMGVSDQYIGGVLERLSVFDNESDLAEAIDRELYKAAQFALMEDDEEDATGKGSEDASGKGAVFARPVAKQDAASTLKGKKKKKMEMAHEGYHEDAHASMEDPDDEKKRIKMMAAYMKEYGGGMKEYHHEGKKKKMNAGYHKEMAHGGKKKMNAGHMMNAGHSMKMEHLDALFSGEDLTPEFKAKTAAIFEAAVNARVEEVQAELVRQSRDVFVEEVTSAKADMAEKLDDYMNYVVSEWMSENELAIDSGIQTEVTESFMTGLRDLFESHYIEVPESKVDLVDALTSKVDALTEKLNESIHENVQLSNAKTVSNCDALFEAACHGLAATEVEKFKSLARGIEYRTEDEFATKLATIKESYFNSSARGVSGLLTETVEDYTLPSNAVASTPIVENLDPRMSAYFNSVGRLADHERQNSQS